jgi:ribosome-binding factor A
VAERLRVELSSALGLLSDPRIQGLIVTRIQVTDDLGLAKVYIRRELGGDPASVDAALRGLASAAGKLRTAAASALGLRTTPLLRFYYDDAPDAVSRIEEVLRELKG